MVFEDSPMFYTIYKITNRVNGKYYIGKHQTKDLNDEYMGSGKYLKRAINKYGIENFSKEILHIFKTESEMNAKEKELVVISEETYNLLEGGQGGFSYINSKGLNVINGYLGGKSFKKKLEDPSFFKDWYEKNEKSKRNPEVRKKMSEGLRLAHKEGRLTSYQINTPEAKQVRLEKYKVIKHQQGERNSQYGTCWITNGIENKKIKKEDLNNWTSLGYNKGRVCK